MLMGGLLNVGNFYLLMVKDSVSTSELGSCRVEVQARVVV